MPGDRRGTPRGGKSLQTTDEQSPYTSRFEAVPRLVFSHTHEQQE